MAIISQSGLFLWCGDFPLAHSASDPEIVDPEPKVSAKTATECQTKKL